MILDTEQQRQFLLEMFKVVQIPGAAVDAAYQLKQAILQAQITSPEVTTFNESLR